MFLRVMFPGGDSSFKICQGIHEVVTERDYRQIQKWLLKLNRVVGGELDTLPFPPALSINRCIRPLVNVANESRINP